MPTKVVRGDRSTSASILGDKLFKLFKVDGIGLGRLFGRGEAYILFRRIMLWSRPCLSTPFARHQISVAYGGTTTMSLTGDGAVEDKI